MKSLLVIDDDLDILQMLKTYFESKGMVVSIAQNTAEALERLSRNHDLILLDVGLPDGDGFELCQSIRSHINCPILFLTARTDEEDRIKGLLLGGDDYICKPFSLVELYARVSAHLRREQRNNAPAKVSFQNGLVFHYGSRTVYYDNEPVALTKTEYDILELLSLNSKKVFTKDAIYETVRGYDAEGDSSIVTEHVRRIRMKLKKLTDTEYIETLWGVGYRWKS